MLKLKFNEETNIIKENKNNISKIVCAKILWIESNIEQIVSIIKILEYSSTIFKDKKDKLIQNIEKLIFKDDKEKDFMSEIKLSINIKEINKCYCILLKSIIFFIISDEIELKEKNMEQFCKILKEINSILQNLNNNLNLDLKEIYIIDELIQIIEIFSKNKNINIKVVIEIKNILRENNLIIQNYINKDIDNSLIEKIINNFEKIYVHLMENVEKKDEFFYDKLSLILFKEIQIINNNDYRLYILKKVLQNNEIIKKSINIFEIIFNDFGKTDKYFINNLPRLLKTDDILIEHIEKVLNNNNIILSETIFYLFEKNSLRYVNDIINNNQTEIYLENEPFR